MAVKEGRTQWSVVLLLLHLLARLKFFGSCCARYKAPETRPVAAAEAEAEAQRQTTVPPLTRLFIIITSFLKHQSVYL